MSNTGPAGCAFMVISWFLIMLAWWTVVHMTEISNALLRVVEGLGR